MNKYYIIEPQIPGGIGDRCVSRMEGNQGVFEKVHYELEWFPDSVIQHAGIFLVSDSLREKFDAAGFSGIEYDVVEVTLDEEFEHNTDDMKDNSVPNFSWMKPVGEVGVDDVAYQLSAFQSGLVVSEAVLKIMTEEGIENAIVKEWNG